MTAGTILAEDNAVRIVDAFVNELDLPEWGFEGVKVNRRHAQHGDLIVGDSEPLGPEPAARKTARKTRCVVR